MAAIAWLLSKTLLIIYTRVCVSVSVCARQREAECVAGVVQWVNGAKQRGVRATHACVCSLLLGEPTTLRPATFTMSGLLLAASTPLSLSRFLSVSVSTAYSKLCTSAEAKALRVQKLYLYICVCVCVFVQRFGPLYLFASCMSVYVVCGCGCVCVCVCVWRWGAWLVRRVFPFYPFLVINF